MRATFTQEQLDIAKTVGELARDEPVTARSCFEQGWSEPRCDAALLTGFSMLGVPESAGGAGSSLVDLLVAVEQLGRHLVPSRFVAHAAALQLATDTGRLDDDLLDGRQVATLAVDVPGFPGWSPGPGDPPRDTPGLRWTLVPFASTADVVVARGIPGVWVSASTHVTPRVSADPGTPMADLSLDQPSATAAAGAGVRRATLVAAAALCGVAGGAIDLAAAYAKTRHQFGRPIGAFQAVAFQLADAVVAHKAAWDLTLHAAWAVDRGRPEALPETHAAKAAAGRAAVFAAERGIQVHGGMGITAEADPHLFLRRALVLDAWLGRGWWHRRMAGRLRIGQTAAAARVHTVRSEYKEWL